MREDVPVPQVRATPGTITVATAIIVIVVISLPYAKDRIRDIQRYTGRAIRRSVLFFGRVPCAERSLGKVVASDGNC